MKGRAVRFTRPRASQVAWVVDVYENGWRWVRACRRLQDARFWVKQFGSAYGTRIRKFEVSR